MSRATNLDAIIRVLTDEELGEEVKSPQRHLPYDPKSKRIIEPGSSFVRKIKGLFSSEAVHYVVTPDVMVDYAAKNIDLGESTRTGGTLEIKVGCCVHCPRGKERRFVRAVALAESAGALLDETLVLLMKRYAWTIDQKNENVISSILQHPETWQDEISQKLLARTGLEATLSFELAREPESKRIREKLEVTVADSHERLNIRYGADFEPEDPNEALLNYERISNLDEVVRSQTQRWFNIHCELDDFCLREGEVRAHHRNDLELLAKSMGYRLAWYDLELIVPFKVPGSTTYEFKNSCPIKDWDKPVVVDHKLLVEVKSVRLLRDARVEDLGAWFHEKLKETTQRKLFNSTYSRVATRFKPHRNMTEQTIEEDLRYEVAEAARKIGCLVIQHSSTPNIEPIRFLDGFDLGEQSVSLRPKDGMEDVQVSVITRGRLTDLTTIEQLIRPDKPLDEQLQETLIEEARHFMYERVDDENRQVGVTLRDFYIGFRDPHNASHIISFQDTLGKYLSSKLKARFDAEATVTVRQEATQFTERWMDLTQERPSVTVDVRPRQGAVVQLEIGYQIVGVSEDNWQIFTKRRVSVADEVQSISDLIRDHIQMMLGRMISEQEIAWTDWSTQRKLKEVIFESSEGVKDRVRALHGVDIDVIKFARADTKLDEVRDELTDHEFQNQKDLLKLASDAKTTRARALLQKIDQESNQAAPDDQLMKELEDELATLSGRDANPVMGRLVSPHPVVEDSPNEGESFLDSLSGSIRRLPLKKAKSAEDPGKGAQRESDDGDEAGAAV